MTSTAENQTQLLSSKIFFFMTGNFFSYCMIVILSRESGVVNILSAIENSVAPRWILQQSLKVQDQFKHFESFKQKSMRIKCTGSIERRRIWGRPGT